MLFFISQLLLLLHIYTAWLGVQAWEIRTSVQLRCIHPRIINLPKTLTGCQLVWLMPFISISVAWTRLHEFWKSDFSWTNMMNTFFLTSCKCVYTETAFCSTVSTQVACLFKARIIRSELTGAPSWLHLQWGGQRWKSTLSSYQTEYKCSCDPELTMYDWEVREQKSSGERFSSSVSLWITLISNNFQPLSLHNSSRSASLWLILVKLRHVLLKMTLFERKRVLKAAELQRNILPSPPQGHLIF